MLLTLLKFVCPLPNLITTFQKLVLKASCSHKFVLSNSQLLHSFTHIKTLIEQSHFKTSIHEKMPPLENTNCRPTYFPARILPTSKFISKTCLYKVKTGTTKRTGSVFPRVRNSGCEIILPGLVGLLAAWTRFLDRAICATLP